MIYKCKQDVFNNNKKWYYRLVINNMGDVTISHVAYYFKYSADLADLQHFIQHHIDLDENARYQEVVVRYDGGDDEISCILRKLQKVVALKNIKYNY